MNQYIVLQEKEAESKLLTRKDSELFPVREWNLCMFDSVDRRPLKILTTDSWVNMINPTDVVRGKLNSYETETLQCSDPFKREVRFSFLSRAGVPGRQAALFHIDIQHLGSYHLQSLPFPTAALLKGLACRERRSLRQNVSQGTASFIKSILL